ncbi:uncharacterized protein J7T54_007507 [Emericellopsis cladophorae]|uniref:Cenp-O kinetochore centromere component n=1 Tax=Emericellopsis cladophorae TaxID=2686198 RepID=A0A9P9XYM1_9HYPO|nr:uncharacterized protein J7T54_007507 [Emericellopsis cladophorae]KAI6780031.1 hypothetical protein J7T54_007507 [Emericellopsis cladophorae]
MTTEAERLDEEIAALKADARRQLAVETSTIVATAAGQALLANDTALRPYAEKQAAHLQQNYHRIVTPVTSFKVIDPDPHAVDGGHVLALRFEAMTHGRYLHQYYVMLNRPYPHSKHLRVHRHTIPPAIPLAGFAARCLPSPKPDSETPPQQDLDRFARAIRREITRYHNRLGVMADLKRTLFGLHHESGPVADDVVEVNMADLEAKQIALTWADGRIGRLVMDDNGQVTKMVVQGPEGRDWELEREVLASDDSTMEDVVRQLQHYAAREG